MIKKLKLKKITLENNLILAPLAGYTDIAMRRLSREFGAGLTITEMVSAKGLMYKNPKTEELLRCAVNESPSCAQLFGAEADIIAGMIADSPALKDFDIIDINMGCPVKKVTSCGEGSALLKDLGKAEEIVAAAAAATARPVTVKIRTGWDEQSVCAKEAAKRFERAGAAMLTVHGRTTKQGYTGKADWQAIYETAAAVNIPVIGNGDISEADDANEKLKNVSGIMIGRGAIGRPQIFSEILGKAADEPLQDIMLRHLRYMTEYFGAYYAAVNMRKFMAFYLKGMRGSKEIKNRVNFIENPVIIEEIIREFFKDK